jgi:hypothetical protein
MSPSGSLPTFPFTYFPNQEKPMTNKFATSKGVNLFLLYDLPTRIVRTGSSGETSRCRAHSGIFFSARRTKGLVSNRFIYLMRISRILRSVLFQYFRYQKSAIFMWIMNRLEKTVGQRSFAERRVREGYLVNLRVGLHR